ncbi:hypothetical protein D3C87_579610 [compost metagenome]
MIQTEHDDDDYDVRTIFTKNGENHTYKTEIKKKGEWIWNGIQKIKSYSSEAIAYLSRNKSGNIELKIKKGETINKTDLADALLKHVGINPASLDHALWAELPLDIPNTIGIQLAERCKIAQKQANTSSEGKLCGTIFSIPDTITVGEWEIKFGNVEFSSVAKEKSCGTDIAVLLHATDKTGRSAIKTLWFQAKKDIGGNIPLNKLDGLEDQFNSMRKITNASYPLIITSKRTYVLEDFSKSKIINFNDFISEAIKCHYGDTRKEIYAESIDRTTIFEVAIKKVITTRKK